MCVNAVPYHLRHETMSRAQGPLVLTSSGALNTEGAVLYTTKYGSTAEYADWIGAETGLPVFSVLKNEVNLSEYGFLIVATPVIYDKLLITDWVQENPSKLDGKRGKIGLRSPTTQQE